ncbi:type II toxin-antitoxin system HicA family toxin [Candidatus Parcubacteria bacterium]|nr:type II toxin-antitoxin system HicA family toxin [Candidatus Parcubacteria bacterium]
MPKLSSLTSKKLIKILKYFGFELDHTTGSHFIFYNPKNKKRAVAPFHKKDLPKGTLASILREAGIDRKEFEKAMKKK